MASNSEYHFSTEGVQEELSILPHSENREKIVYELPLEIDFIHSAILQKNIKEAVPITDYVKESKMLTRLNIFFKEWVEEMAINRNIFLKDDVCGIIYPFGSYRLGVASVGSDIDCVCICPYFIGREDFFTKFSEKLKENRNVEHIHVIYAMVPLIQLKIESFEVDLSYAGCTLEVFPKTFSFISNEIIYQFEKESILTISGIRFNDTLLSLIPPTSFLSFKVCLVSLKLWAKRRCIYNNKIGYLGGIHLCILVARLCQIYPLATASQLLIKFFEFYGAWVWPRPIFLTPIQYGGMLKWDVWNPFENETDAEHVMPIITPTYPSRNTAYNATTSTLYLIQKEIDRGKRIIIENRAGSYQTMWDTLVSPSRFLGEIDWVLRVKMGAPYKKENAKKWADFVESRIRFLIKGLELVDGVNYAIPFSEMFSEKESVVNSVYYFILFIGLIVKEENVPTIYHGLGESQDTNNDDISTSSSSKILDLSYPLKTWKKDQKTSKKRPDIAKPILKYSIVRYSSLPLHFG